MTIPGDEYRARRERFAGYLGERGIAIIPAARLRRRNGDVRYPLRQDSDFRYLCDFPEEDAVLVLAPGRQSGSFVLFCNPRDPARELWDGVRLGTEGACAAVGADEAFALDRLDELMPAILHGRDTVYCPLDAEEWLPEKLRGWMRAMNASARAGVRTPQGVVNLSANLHEMRLIKSDAEVEILRTAGAITVDAHARAMESCAVGGWEYQLEAALYYEFCRRGARHWAYPPIVGSGDNCCVLHYSRNDAPLNHGAMVLIDAGCELNGYAADISRSFPVAGHFTSEQAALYDVVSEAQRAAIAAAKPGNSVETVHRAAVEVLVAGMVDLGLMKGKPGRLLRGTVWRRFYPHRTSHWLGLDVHDVGAYVEQDGSPRLLRPGMVLTVEPGLYVQPSERDVASAFRGLGVRIEDDILITETGAAILNPDRLRTRAEIEQCVGAALAS